MQLFGRDTHPKAARVLIEGFRRMTPEQRLAQVDDLSRAARHLAELRIRAQYPDATDHEVRMRLGALTLGRKTMQRAFGWDPEREGW